MRSLLLPIRSLLLVLATWLYRGGRWLLDLAGLGNRRVGGGDRFLCSSVWDRIFRVWDLHGKDYLTHAPERDCPLCQSSSKERLWPTEDGYTYVFCTECGMVYTTPGLTNETWLRYFDEHGNELAPISRALAETKLSDAALSEDRERFTQYLALIRKHSKGPRLLDIGCFTGNFLAVAREKGYQPTGIEFYEDAVRMGSAFHALDIRQGFFEELAPTLTASPSRFDVITLWEALEHMPHPRRVLDQCYELLEADGIVAITVPNFDCLHVRLLREKCPHALGGPGTPGHMCMFTESTLTDIVARTGFEVCHLSTEAGTDWVDVLNYLSLDFHRISSYGQALRGETSDQRQSRSFLPQSVSNAIVILSPLWRVLENACNRGAILRLVARKRGKP